MSWLFEADSLAAEPLSGSWSEAWLADSGADPVKGETASDPRLYAFAAGEDGGPLATEDEDGDVVDDIIVNGPSPNPVFTGGGGGGGPATGGGGTGDGSGTIQLPPRPYDECEDRRADSLAEEINREIQTKADSDSREYGALIWRDDSGNLHRTDVTHGENGQWTPPSAPSGNGFDGWSQIVAIVHSHPTVVYANGQSLNVTPESHFEKPSSGDYENLSFYIGNSASGANLTTYISHAGMIREFDWSDNKAESRNPNDQSPGHGTESGDYRPGTACS